LGGHRRTNCPLGLRADPQKGQIAGQAIAQEYKLGKYGEAVMKFMTDAFQPGERAAASMTCWPRRPRPRRASPDRTGWGRVWLRLYRRSADLGRPQAIGKKRDVSVHALCGIEGLLTT